MGLPNIVVNFKEQASTFIRRSQKGTIAIILRDSTPGNYTLYSKTEIPSGLSAANKAFIERAFIGNENEPKKVILCVIGAEADIETALACLETAKFDYLTFFPYDVDDATSITVWIEAEREIGHKVKAVLSNTAADSEAIINFTTDGIKVGATNVDTDAFCGRIAGLIVGTPLTQSVTYAILPEVTEVEKMTKTEIDSAIDGGEFILFSDSEKVKVGRGVTSLETTTGKIAAMKKIKVVETMDMIESDIKTTCEDTYIGKFSNSYDNKCILMASIKGYLQSLEADGILQAGTSEVGIDIEAQRAYLITKGIDVSEMTEQEIKEHNTDDKVFILATIKILDAIEDITLNIMV